MRSCCVLIFLLIFLNACATHSISQLNPKAATYNVELGLGYFQQGNVERAKQKLLLALQQAPNDPVVLDAMGYFLESTAEPEQAQSYYQRALKIAPHKGATQNNYGTFLCRRGRYQEAIKHFLLATQDSQYLRTAQAYENAGRCALKIPAKTLAEKYLQKAIATDPNLATALLEMAMLSYNDGQYSLAKNYYQRYAKLVKPSQQAMALAVKIRENLPQRRL